MCWVHSWWLAGICFLLRHLSHVEMSDLKFDGVFEVLPRPNSFNGNGFISWVKGEGGAVLALPPRKGAARDESILPKAPRRAYFQQEALLDSYRSARKGRLERWREGMRVAEAAAAYKEASKEGDEAGRARWCRHLRNIFLSCTSFRFKRNDSLGFFPNHNSYGVVSTDFDGALFKVVVWVAAPAMIRAGSTTAVMTVLLVAFLLEYLPKIYHSVSFLRRTQDKSGHIFGTIWWGIVLNLMAYFVAAHAVGACWYLLGVQRATKCLKEQCSISGPPGCASGPLACPSPLYYGGAGTAAAVAGDRLAWATDATARSMCLVSGDKYQFGAYKWTVMLVANTSRLEKMLLPIFWGLMTLSTFGNLESTTEWLEIVFNIVTITGGLILVTMLIGNIKVFLNATTSKKQAMHTRLRSLEWWMKRKELPQSYRHRVRQFERQRWAATRGVDECQIVRDLPEALRRDIKYHLCLDLVRQVPLFQHMDDLVLENMCDRVRSLIYPKGETIVREGDPVQRMVFIRRGEVSFSYESRME
ncbi:hypothetical protein TRIUR3_19052 [Triticum urartu]|uniref:Uncharacterized protein n=1 Tax=Triticum urartu TaxID=4572 RepID=M7ZTF3_TRIUA|nr:hypothetical protein TRIUR3_19052 [Triticum urartu]